MLILWLLYFAVSLGGALINKLRKIDKIRAAFRANQPKNEETF
jgi:hypothetical protein